MAEERAKKDIAVLKERSDRLVAEAKTETVERFLKYGYAAEFLEYQKHLKLGDHGKEEAGGK